MQTVGIGHQNFEQVITKDIFYIDKTRFIKDWWESEDQVTLITRPRRFGKTLNMSMTEQFFSVKYENRGDLFEGLSIWAEDDAIIIEFKVFRPAKEQNLEDTVRDALDQIRDRRYGALLEEKGVASQRIRAYGFAFSGKNVLIGA